MTIRDSEQRVVVNHAGGEMAGPMATALHIRDFPPFVSDEPSDCPVDSLTRAAVPDYRVTWERL